MLSRVYACRTKARATGTILTDPIRKEAGTREPPGESHHPVASSSAATGAPACAGAAATRSLSGGRPATTASTGGDVKSQTSSRASVGRNSSESVLGGGMPGCSIREPDSPSCDQKKLGMHRFHWSSRPATSSQKQRAAPPAARSEEHTSEL